MCEEKKLTFLGIWNSSPCIISPIELERGTYLYLSRAFESCRKACYEYSPKIIERAYSINEDMIHRATYVTVSNLDPIILKKERKWNSVCSRCQMSSCHYASI